MGELQLYGSEFHLLRQLGRHRKAFSQGILERISERGDVDWLDFSYSLGEKYFDKEITGLRFLEALNLGYPNAKKTFDEFWPSTGTPQNWDAVGKTSLSNTILLVEAKAHLDELDSASGAGEPSLTQIRKTFEMVRADLGISAPGDWTRRYYQLANRLFLLWFLNRKLGLRAKLVNVYFVGDSRPDGRVCPQTIDEWNPALDEEYAWLGITDHPFVKETVIPYFVAVNGDSVE